MGEYGTNLQEFSNDMNLFKEYFLENGPKTANKRNFILNFMTKTLADASIYFLKTVKN